MAEAVNEILAKWIAMQIFAMSVDVLHRDLLQRLWTVPTEPGIARLEGIHCSFLCSQNDVVDLALPSSELSIYRRCSSDVSRVHRVFSADIQYNHVAVLHHCRVCGVVENG